MEMIKRCFLIALLSGAAMSAQTKPEPGATGAGPKPQAPADQGAPKPAAPGAPKQEAPANQEVLKPQVYVRRFQAGATLTVAPMNPVATRDSSVFVQSPAFDALYSTTPVAHRIGWGFTGQLALTERFALTANLLFRHAGYKASRDILEGVDNPNTIADERKHTVSNENTSVKFFDIPVAIRFYTKDRHTPGPRGFFELGGALRRVDKISTSISTTVTTATGETTTQSTTAAPYLRSIRGLVAGAGIQLIDPVGIRVVPEVRYTYWLNSTFNNLTTVSTRHQIEAMISLTF